MDEVSNQTVPDLLFKLLASNLSHFYPTCHTLNWSLPSRRVGETQEPPSSVLLWIVHVSRETESTASEACFFQLVMFYRPLKVFRISTALEDDSETRNSTAPSPLLGLGIFSSPQCGSIFEWLLWMKSRERRKLEKQKWELGSGKKRKKRPKSDRFLFLTLWHSGKELASCFSSETQKKTGSDSEFVAYYMYIYCYTWDY